MLQGAISDPSLWLSASRSKHLGFCAVQRYHVRPTWMLVLPSATLLAVHLVGPLGKCTPVGVQGALGGRWELAATRGERFMPV